MLLLVIMVKPETGKYVNSTQNLVFHKSFAPQFFYISSTRVSLWTFKLLIGNLFSIFWSTSVFVLVFSFLAHVAELIVQPAESCPICVSCLCVKQAHFPEQIPTRNAPEIFRTPPPRKIIFDFFVCARLSWLLASFSGHVEFLRISIHVYV